MEKLIFTTKSDMERVCEECSDIEKDCPVCGLEFCDDDFEMCSFCREREWL